MHCFAVALGLHEGTVIGIVNLSGRGMLVLSVARQLGSGNSFARLLCCPAQAERGRKKAPWSVKLTWRYCGPVPSSCNRGLMPSDPLRRAGMEQYVGLDVSQEQTSVCV